MMSGGAPLLSICIPTFNRDDQIGSTLDSLIGQMTPQVEVVIVDSSSADVTEAVVKGYQKRSQSIRYIRLPTASGVDRDMDAGVREARGRFCWLMSDDDLVAPGAVDRLFRLCNEGHDLIVANAEIRDFSMVRVLKERCLDLDADRVYPPEAWDSFFASTVNHMSFMPSVIIKRSVWLERDRESYFDSEFLHVGVVFQAPLEGTVLVCAEPLLSIRHGNWNWIQRYVTIWLFQWSDLLWSLPSISDAAKRRIVPRGGWRELRHLAFYRGLGGLTEQVLSEYRATRRVSAAQRAAISLINAVPVPVMNSMAARYYTWRKDWPAVELSKGALDKWRETSEFAE